MKNKRIIVTVINDLATDQRVKKVCQALYDMGFDILLVGRRLKGSLPIENRPYRVKRLYLLFTKGPAFYACFNIRLFFLLFFSRADVFHANDLDTLLPVYLVSKLKRKRLVYDSHELFTEVPELVSRPRVKAIWEHIEKRIFPKLKYVFTVNDSIAEYYQSKYGVNVRVLRNLPVVNGISGGLSYEHLGLDRQKKYVILQGAGINIQRGAEELVDAMQYLEDIILIVTGDGDVVPFLKQMTKKLSIEEKVKFYPKMPYEQLMQLTACASCGVTLDKDTNLNYRYSLPNKLFDYIRAGIPVLASDLPEVRKIVEGYHVGLVVSSHDPKEIAAGIRQLTEFPSDHLKDSLKNAARELCWENEKHKLTEVYEEFQ